MNRDKKIIYIENQAYRIIQDLLFEDSQYYLVDCLNQELHPLEDFAFVIEEKEEESDNVSYLLVEEESLKETLAELFLPLIISQNDSL